MLPDMKIKPENKNKHSKQNPALTIC